MLADMEDFFTYLTVSVITISCVMNIYGYIHPTDTVANYRYKNTG